MTWLNEHKVIEEWAVFPSIPVNNGEPLSEWFRTKAAAKNFKNSLLKDGVPTFMEQTYMGWVHKGRIYEIKQQYIKSCRIVKRLTVIVTQVDDPVY